MFLRRIAVHPVAAQTGNVGAAIQDVADAAVDVTFAGIQKVFTVKDNKAVERPVVTGQREEDWIEITEGLKAGEMVVATPGNLVTGQPVSIEK